MPRAKKKEPPPKLELVTSKSKSGTRKATKSSAKQSVENVSENVNDNISSVPQAVAGRSKRTASSKPKAWEALIPKTRDNSLIDKSSMNTPPPVKTSQKHPPENPASEKSAEKIVTKPSRSRSTTKKPTKSDVAAPKSVQQTEPPASKPVRQARTVSGKRETEKQNSVTSETGASRQSSRARSQKEEISVHLTETEAESASGRQSRAVSAKSKSVTAAATVPSRQSSRAKTKEKTVSPSPAKDRGKAAEPGKTEARQSSRAKTKEKTVSPSPTKDRGKAAEPAKPEARQSSRAKTEEKTVSPSPAKDRGKAAEPAKPQARQSSRARVNKDKPATANDPEKPVARQTSRARGTKDTNNSVESSSEKVKDSVAPVKRSSKGRGNKSKGRGNKSKGNKVSEESLTEISKTNNVSLVTPVEECIIKDTFENTSQGKWKSFSSQNLSLKNKRLSKELDISTALNNSASKKRKPSMSTEEFDPTPTKKPVRALSRKVGFQSIASSFAKNGEIIQKNAPRKTLCNLDILGLLDDGVDEVAEDNLEPAVEEGEPSQEIPLEKEPLQVSNVSTTENSSFSKLKDKVPVWRKQADISKSVGSSKAFDDVFNPENYGEEEFGPEDLNPKKKRVRKKKKDTKAILVFGTANSGKTGKNAANQVKKAVKESHNLKTPEVAKKKTRKAAVEAGKKLIQPIPNIFDNPPTSSKEPNKVPAIKVTYSSDFSHGAQNYFDSEIHQYEPAGDDMDNNDDNFDVPEPSEEFNRSGAFGVSLDIPSKNYKTPAIPKKISRLQTENSSTPNQKEAPKPVPVTIQEQIKCAFGFDDSEEDDGNLSSENESISISPVRKVINPVLAMFENDSVITEGGSSRLSTISGSTGGTRMSTMTGIGRLSSIQGSNMGANISRGAQIPIIRKQSEPRKDGPFRVNLPPPRMISVEKQLQAQVRALKEKEMKKKLAASKKPSRISPRKPMHSSTMNGDPIHSSTLLDFDRFDAPKPKNAYEMMKEASLNPKDRVKKLVKKVPKNLPVLEQSSLYEDPPQATENLAKLSGNDSDNQKLSDKENSDTNSPQKTMKPAVSRVYKRKSVNNSTASKPSVSFDQSKKTPKKVSKKEKAIKVWTQLQTSHFSEVDDFDLSFG